jgi:hypothetical protein
VPARIRQFALSPIGAGHSHRPAPPDAWIAIPVPAILSYLAAGGGAGDIAQQLQNLHEYHALYRSEDYQPFAHVRLAEP